MIRQDGYMEDINDQYNPHEVEREIKSYWRDIDAYRKTVDAHRDDPDYYFLDGPPYTSGRMHLGTAWNKTLKDAVIRYLRMQGHNVTDRPGYDMHGLPIEVKVEEKLGFESKTDIEEFGVENFIDECIEFAEDNLDAMNDDFKSMAVWMDWDDPYRTVSNEYIEGAWWGFKKAHSRGLVEKGQRVINQCPRCETAIADAEVEYEEIESPSIYVKFKLENREGSLVIWTTTPWTIPANLYVAVDPDVGYSRIRASKNGESEVLYITSDLVEEVLKKGRYDDYEVLEEIEGDELEGLRYKHPLLDEVPRQEELSRNKDVHKVYTADFVSTERTGLVHCAPGHGVDDFERGKELDLPVFSPVNEDGFFTDDAGEYSHGFVRDVNDEIIDDLRDNGSLLFQGRHSHRYGQCWRCDTSIIFLAKDQWFITVTDIKDRLLEEIEQSEWFPEWARDSRFRDWVENARDWNVSRQRYWGIPIPIWICDEGHRTCIGTIDEMREKAIDDPGEIDLHRPGVDDVYIECGECGGKADRVEDIFDVWLDSSVASWAALDYPEEEEDFERYWPADLIIEAHDQTRGWFWSQLGMGVSALDEIPYRKVVMHGHALDEDGRKMSKSLGNIVTPEEAIDRHGVDPLRAFLLSHDQQGEDLRFSWDEIEDKQRSLNVLWNTHRFPLPYMELDDFDASTTSISDEDLQDIDRWILSRLQNTKKKYMDYMDNYEVHAAQDELHSFLMDDLSRFYVQVIRPRMWDEEDSSEKRAAYITIFRVLEEGVKMLAPFTPLISEKIYQNLHHGEKIGTIHSKELTGVDQELIDDELESYIDVVREIEEVASTGRQRADRNRRWPLRKVVITSDDDLVYDAIDSLRSLVKERLNAEEIEVTDG